MAESNQKERIAFLCRAKKAAYAGNGPESPASRPASHDLQYAEDGYQYIDTYLGGNRFSGEEAIWEHENPVWAMNYSGRVIDGKFSGDFLKEALLLVPETSPFRGPSRYQAGGYTYQCTFEGQFEWYQGYEEILYNGVKVYECYFHGGIIE